MFIKGKVAFYNGFAFRIEWTSYLNIKYTNIHS